MDKQKEEEQQPKQRPAERSWIDKFLDESDELENTPPKKRSLPQSFIDAFSWLDLSGDSD